VVIAGNTVATSGIRLEGGTDNQVTDNVLKGGIGITLSQTTGATITGNILDRPGIMMAPTTWHPDDSENHFYHDIRDNTVSGRPIRYYLNQSGVVVPGDPGQLILVNCKNMSANGVDAGNMSTGVFLFNSSNTVIQNASFQSCRTGISLFFSHNNSIAGCVGEKGGLGIYLYDSHDNRFRDNAFSNNSDEAARLSASHRTSFLNNTFTGNRNEGVFVFRSNNTIFQGNNISGNRDNGIYLTDSHHTLITGNTITGNTGNGIYLKHEVQGTTVHYNNIAGNSAFGIDIFEKREVEVDARYNWWGHESGPRHPGQNPDGQGDKLSVLVDFEPWLEEESTAGPGREFADEGDDEQRRLPVCMILVALVLVLGLLAIVVCLPESHFRKQQPSPRQTWIAEGDEGDKGSRENTKLCPHCGGEFQVTTSKRPLHFSCHFCGKEIVFN